MLDFLFAHQLQPKYQYAHRWTVGDVLIWDHLGTLHNAIPDYGPDEERLMLRCQVMAETIFDPRFQRMAEGCLNHDASPASSRHTARPSASSRPTASSISAAALGGPMRISPPRWRPAHCRIWHATRRRYPIRPGRCALLPAVPSPLRKVLCVGLNYRAHVAESGRREVPENPRIFARLADTIIGDGAPLWRPVNSTHFDYEGELAVVIGKPGRRIPAGARWVCRRLYLLQ